MTNASIEQTTAKTAVRVSVVSIIANTVLSIGKAAAGILAHSPAMISDGVHSASSLRTAARRSASWLVLTTAVKVAMSQT